MKCLVRTWLWALRAYDVTAAFCDLVKTGLKGISRKFNGGSLCSLEGLNNLYVWSVVKLKIDVEQKRLTQTFKKGDVENGGVKVDELKAEHFYGEGIFVIFVRSLSFHLGEFERQPVIAFVKGHDGDEIDASGGRCHDELVAVLQGLPDGDVFDFVVATAQFLHEYRHR